ncbi:MAG TPA: hypothetical protein VFU19_17055 [Iamia sp.]|nr:hypothetical protein [Iamia sp.]
MTPAGQWTSPPTGPGYGYGAPPPGYPPPGGYPSGGSARKGSGAVVALVAVGVVALLLVAAIVGLVVLSGGDDDDPERAGDRGTTTEAADTTEPPPDTELPPDTTAPPGSTDTTSPVPTPPSLPGTGTNAPPDGFPDPPGARESITGGIEVPGMTAAQLAAFYEAELPGAGYTVDRVDDIAGTFVLTISGPDSGVLSIVEVATLPATAIWTAT